MRDQNAAQLLARIMGWSSQESVVAVVPILQLLANYKYDSYQRFSPGLRFIESLALWLRQFTTQEDKNAALELVNTELVFFSEPEIHHLVELAYPDVIVHERIRMVAEENQIATHRVHAIASHSRFRELQHKTLYLGLSDGARTNDLRRASDGEIGNEQIWHAYELGDAKAADMLEALRSSLGAGHDQAFYNIVWLLDDFSGSGNTYIRYDPTSRQYKGKIRKIYQRLQQGDLVDDHHHEIYLLLYVATRQAIEHIEYWSERFTSEMGYKPLQVRVICPLESDVSLIASGGAAVRHLLRNATYFDERAADRHIRVGGTDGRLGFADCALPVVLSHNTPNNSVYILWGPSHLSFFGLFPRASRHRGF